jgi:hypothetical protein
MLINTTMDGLPVLNGATLQATMVSCGGRPENVAVGACLAVDKSSYAPQPVHLPIEIILPSRWGQQP